MACIIADRVKETSTTTGTGALTLAGAMTGYRAFSTVCTSPSDICYYCIQAVDGSGNPTGAWEVGLGTYSGANTLTRTSVLSSSNANSVVTLAAGTKQVWIDLAAAQVGYTSAVWVVTCNGYGSTNTVIRRFTTVNLNTGTDITYADSAANGASFTINNPGLYAIVYTDQPTTAGPVGISLNSSQLSTVIYSITAADRIAGTYVGGYGSTVTAAATLYLSPGDIIRPHSSVLASGGSTWAESFRIARIG